jgi:LemA protein
MEVVLIIIAAVFLGVLGYVVAQYNGFVALRNHIAESWSDIDTELKRRYELIPNLVTTVKAYAAHERDVLERVTRLRSQCAADHGTPAQQSVNENQLTDALRQLLAVVENYPALKADEHFRKLQDELIVTENRIQAARRFFNGNVRDYRNKRESVPTNLIASAFHFPDMEFFEVEPIERTRPVVLR